MFKKIILAIIMLTLSLSAAEVKWAKDYKSGMQEALKQNKPVLFIISRDTCKYCVLLDNTTLQDDKVVQELNKNFITIRSWTNEGDYIPAVLSQNTPGLPGIWFLYPNGNPMYQPLLGYVKAPDFFGALKTVESEFQKNSSKGKK
ncbi:thioredoxin family protein [Sulfurimonas sp.]